MNSSFWQMHAQAQAAQQDCDSSCCSPSTASAANKCSVDDWLSMPCSAPDCSIPKNPAAGCTDQCVVVTHHVDEKCDGDCDDMSFNQCDMSCDGFDSNWLCESDNCSMSFGQLNPPPPSYGHSHGHGGAHHSQDFGHLFHSNPTYPSFYCPCASGDFAHCNCSAGAASSFYPHNSHHLFHPGGSIGHHHQPTHQAAPLPPKLPLLYATATASLSQPIPGAFSPSHSFHTTPSPMFSHQPSVNTFATPQPPQLPQVLQLPQIEKNTCMWGDCKATFTNTNELLAHLSSAHLPISQAPTAQPVLSTPTSCLWNDCQVHPELHVPSGNLTGAGGDAITNFLATHLLQDHLGLGQKTKERELPTPPPSSTIPALGLLSPATTPSGRAVSELSEDESDTVSPASASLPALDSRSVALSEPESHACSWDDCTEVYPSCDALTSHIASTHVGSGKAQYECAWRGCPRSGGQPFASKQKILRHIQSHTGHRPFQCSVCKQHFSEAATLQQHMRRHTREKPYQCDYPGCGKAFAITGALTIHKRIHNGEKPFKCTFCDRAFSESSNLSKHLRTHTGARPYACLEPGCEKRFARPDQVSRHMNVHRKIIKEEPVL